MAEVKLSGKPQDQRIADRLKNSGAGANPDLTVTKGEGPTRTHTNIHLSARHLTPSNAQHQRGKDGWSKSR